MKMKMKIKEDGKRSITASVDGVEKKNGVSNCKEERNCDDCDVDIDVREKCIIKLGLVLNALPLQQKIIK